MPQTGSEQGQEGVKTPTRNRKCLLWEIEILNQHTGEGVETGGLDRLIIHSGRIDVRYVESKGASASALEQKRKKVIGLI